MNIYLYVLIKIGISIRNLFPYTNIKACVFIKDSNFLHINIVTCRLRVGIVHFWATAR
jgi:hypothetical protein